MCKSQLAVNQVYGIADNGASTKADNAHCRGPQEKLKFSKATSVQLSR